MSPDATYLVSGASSGIGAAVTDRLLAAGAGVVTVSRRIPAIDNEHLTHFECDLSDHEDLAALCRNLSRRPDPFNGLLLCHGQGDFGSLEEFSSARVRALVEVNLVSTIELLRACLPAMKRRGEGRVVLLGSEAGLRGGKKGAVYCATKFALRGLAQSLRQEGAAAGVAVTLVNPGMVDTPFYASADFVPGSSPDNALTAEEVAETMISVLRQRHGAVVDEINLSPLKTVIRNK